MNRRSFFRSLAGAAIGVVVAPAMPFVRVFKPEPLLTLGVNDLQVMMPIIMRAISPHIEAMFNERSLYDGFINPLHGGSAH